MPELSIVVPVYKVEKYLPKCIDSILAQTFRNFELILIDDGSPDRCGEICDAYAAKDPRIVVIHQENQGVSAARNAGLDVAAGTYLGFVDSDDWIEPEMYETMISTAKEKQVDVVICGFAAHGERTYLFRHGEQSYNSAGLIRQIFTLQNSIDCVCWNKLFRRDKIIRCRFPAGLQNYEDTIFLFSCFAKVENAWQVDNCLYNVLERQESASRSKSLSAIQHRFHGYQVLYKMGRKCGMTQEVHALAVQKGLNECVKCINDINAYCSCDFSTIMYKWLRIKTRMAIFITEAFLNPFFLRKKLHGYIYEMIKM